MGYRILSLPGEDVKSSPHPREEKGLWGGRVPAGPCRSWGRDPGSPSLPAVSDRSEGGAGPGPSVRTKQAGEPAGGPGPRPEWRPGGAGRDRGHLPNSSTFFPAGSLERERVETSLRMQDLTGSKAHAEAGGQGPGPQRGRDGHGLGASGRGLPRTRWPGPGAELRRARDP